jgi:hypothetical protein
MAQGIVPCDFIDFGVDRDGGIIVAEEYLTVKELGLRIKMSPGTIRNLVWQKRLMQNIHYLKPTPRKLLFIWSAIEAWLRGGSVSSSELHGVNDKCLIII